MFNPALLKTEAQEFIENFKGDIPKLAFAGSPFEGISVQELIQQIEGKRKTAKKLPTWSRTRGIVFPPKLNLEQTSSELTGQYKASLVSGRTLADITGGYGVDSYFFSERYNSVHHFELDRELSGIAAHNFSVLGKKNIHCFQENGLDGIKGRKYDAIYADPSRRHQTKGKIFYLQDCEPNVVANLSTLLSQCDLFLLKTSPMLDISIGIEELENVSQIHIVAVDNEVKELLWLLQKKEVPSAIQTRTINISKAKTEKLEFEWGKTGNALYNQPQKYLYEPNAAILKSGAFDWVSEKFGLYKLHQNTHLYTSDILIDFPGRRFLIEKTVPYSKAEMRKALTFKKANITTRNFPESVEVLRKKWKLADGGETYLFFTTITTGKQMLICLKV